MPVHPRPRPKPEPGREPVAQTTTPGDVGLHRWIRPGDTVALADGVGSPIGLCRELSAVARDVGNVRLILGWHPAVPDELDLQAFTDVRCFLPGRALRPAIASGAVHYVPVYLSQVPALLAGTWRPDLLVAAVRDTSQGLTLGSEVSWIGSAARAARACVAERNAGLPAASPPSVLQGANVTVVSDVDRPPVVVAEPPTDELAVRIAAEVVAFVTPCATIQFGPGALGRAVVDALDVPVAVDSGIATDALVDLDARGLLLGDPHATYLAGSERLYAWADGRSILRGVDERAPHAPLDPRGLVAINSALEIDRIGQVAIDGPTSSAVSGVGGHMDYAYASSASVDGLSIIALPSRRQDRATLVERLTAPVATPRSLVDVIVTEHGSADVRGLTDDERAAAIAPLFP